MRTPPRPEPTVPTEPVVPEVAALRTASGIWSLQLDQLVSVESFDVGPAVVLVPSESVLLLVVDLPLPTRARRLAALPFAVEDQLSEPIEDVHVALGVEVGPGRFLAGVVRHELMRRWTSTLAAFGLERASLVPDALALPVPGAGSWSIDLTAERAMVRREDATGFALPLAHLEAAWKMAGQPSCVAYGGTPPPTMGAANAAMEAEPLAARLVAPGLDLRQGPYAPPRRAVHPLWRRIALVAALGLGAHAAIAAAETIALSRSATMREAEARATIASVAPDLEIGDDLGAAAASFTPAVTSTPGSFLPLLSRSSRALATVGAPVVMRSIGYDAADAALTIEVEAPDIAGLQRVGAALTAAGLTAEAGGASVDLGRAVGSFTVRAP